VFEVSCADLIRRSLMETLHSFSDKMYHPSRDITYQNNIQLPLNCVFCSPKEPGVSSMFKFTKNKEKGKAFFAESCQILGLGLNQVHFKQLH